MVRSLIERHRGSTARHQCDPCPFCGGKARVVIGLFASVCCRNARCKAEGPLRKTPGGAESAWNKRTAQS